MKEKYPCLHCGEETNKQDLIDEKFCCLGCAGAYEIVNDLGLSSYYESRINDPKIRSIKPEENAEMDLESFICQTVNGDFELLLAIDGLHCAACVWLIENLLKKEQNVTFSRINLAKKYLRLKWKGSKAQGMEFVNLIQKIGYKLYPFDEEVLTKEEEKYSSTLIKKLAVAGFGAGNLMLFSIALWIYDVEQMGRQTTNLMHFFSAIIALPCIIYSSSVFFKSAFLALKNKRMNMDVTISTALILTLAVSFYQIFHDAKDVYFDSAMTLCFFLLIGRYLDFKARKKAFDVGKEFSLLSSNFARIIDENNEVKIIAAKNIKAGMTLLVWAGEKIAADGEIIDGESEIDNAIITGESKPVQIKKGSQVFASAINLSNAVKIKVGNAQQESLLKQIQTIIEESENHKNKFVKIADKIAGYYTPVIHVMALLTFLGWYFLGNGDVQESLLNAIALLVISCPCALALAVPITQSLTISYALKNGIIIKSGEAIEKISNIKNFVFDKTGTLTIGKPKLVQFLALNRKLNEAEKEFYLKMAASLALNSSHPFSKAICDSFEGVKSEFLAKEKKGFGVEGSLDGEIIRLGKKDFVENFDEKYEIEIDENYSATYFSYRDDILVFYFEDGLKKDAKEFIQEMKTRCDDLILLSGDDSKIVEKTALDLGFDHYFAEKNPVEKIAILQKLKEKNISFAMIGDGINDAGSLAIADVSISFANASNLTQNVADVIVNKDSLGPILDFISLAKRSIRITKQNLGLSLIYNCFTIILAILGMVNPMMAAIAMSSSSLIVTLNSIRVIRKT